MAHLDCQILTVPPLGSPAEVIAETHKKIEELTKGGWQLIGHTKELNAIWVRSQETPAEAIKCSFPNGMTVTELKAVVATWPEKNNAGEPATVWITDDTGTIGKVRSVYPDEQGDLLVDNDE